MKTLLVLISALTFGCARLHAWPAVVFNPTNGVVMLPTNFVAANLSSVPVTNNFSGTATNLTGPATNQVQALINASVPTNITVGFTGTVTNLASLAGGLSTNYTANYNNIYLTGTSSNAANGMYIYIGGNLWTNAGGWVLDDAGSQFPPTAIEGGPIFTNGDAALDLYINSAPDWPASAPTGDGVNGDIGGQLWIGTNSVVTTNGGLHFNLTTYTNGVCLTNIFQ